MINGIIKAKKYPTKKRIYAIADNAKYYRSKLVKEFLKNSRIDYIFYSNLEQKIGTFNPDEKEYLKKVYDNGKVQIYKVL